MERIISYDELPESKGQSIYFRMETDPSLYLSLLSKGYTLINNIRDAEEKTIYVTGRRQDYYSSDTRQYLERINGVIQDSLRERGIEKPLTYKFSFLDLLEHNYKIPFVLKNEFCNGGKEKFLIATEEDYENLIKSCSYLLDKNMLVISGLLNGDKRYLIDYEKYLDSNFTVQEYVDTPTEYNTTVRLLTSPSKDLLYASLKYNEKEEYKDTTTLLGYLLHDVYPLSTPSIVSNTLSGGHNLLLGEKDYSDFDRHLLDSHDIDSDVFERLVHDSEDIHSKYNAEFGIICGFDYIYDKEKQKWFLLEYHSRPMVGDYSKRQGISYTTREEKKIADGRVRATALSLILKK